MTVSESKLKKLGYQRVASDLHAYQLIRWQMKRDAKDRQRGSSRLTPLSALAIKPGAWVKFCRYEYPHFIIHRNETVTRRQTAMLIYVGPVADKD